MLGCPMAPGPPAPTPPGQYRTGPTSWQRSTARSAATAPCSPWPPSSHGRMCGWNASGRRPRAAATGACPWSRSRTPSGRRVCGTACSRSPPTRTGGSAAWKCSTATASRCMSSSRPPPVWGRQRPGSTSWSSTASSHMTGERRWPATSLTPSCARTPAAPGCPRRRKTPPGASTARWPPSWPSTAPPSWPVPPAPTSTSRSVGSGGQLRALLLDVKEVVWLQDDLTGLVVELHHAGEPKEHLAHDAEDDRAVRLHPDLVDADVPDPDLVVTRGPDNCEVNGCQILQDPSVGKGEERDLAGDGDVDLINPALLGQLLIYERVINLDDFPFRRLGRRGGAAEHHHQQRSQYGQHSTGATSCHSPSPLA